MRPQRLSAVRSKGLSLAIKANEAGTARAELLLDKRTAKKLGLRAGVVGRGNATLASAGTAKVRVKLTAKAKAKLARARTVKATVRVVFTDRAGNSSAPATKRLLLKR